MRVKRLTTWLVLGIAVVLAYAARRRRGAPSRRIVPTAADAPGTPAALDERMLFRGDEAGDLFAEAVGGWHVEPDEEPEPDDVVAESTVAAPRGAEVGVDDEEALAEVYGDRRAPLGSGDLYGVHAVTAEDRELPDDDHAQDEGENWLEHLEASAAEMGPQPEHELDVVDDSDPHAGHHKTATSDTPVADHGSGGPGGL